MDVPNILKGYLYPSSRVSRCPRFHRCTVSNKCQNYDPHRLDCSLCELRVVREMNQPLEDVPLGGILPEGEYVPDLQDAVKVLSEQTGVPLAHPDNPTQKVEALGDITDKLAKQRKAADILARFQAAGVMRMEEQIAEALVDPETAKLLGRME